MLRLVETTRGMLAAMLTLDVTSLTSLDVAIMPMYRAFEVGEVHLENLTLTSLNPHYFPQGSDKI